MCSMQVGTMTESVQVTGEAPLLQTDTTQVGAVISSNTIDNTPADQPQPRGIDPADRRRHHPGSRELQ